MRIHTPLILSAFFVAVFILPAGTSARTIPGASRISPRGAEQSVTTRSTRTTPVRTTSATVSSDEKTLLKKALKGDGDAMYELARMYRDGRGVKADKEISFFWMYYADAEGNVNAKTDMQAMVKTMSVAEYMHAAKAVYGFSFALQTRHFKTMIGTDSASSLSGDYASQVSEARDAQRRSDVNTILNAVYQYAIDTKGVLPEGLTAKTTAICRSKIPEATCKAKGLVSLDVLTGMYVVSLPVDPLSKDANSTGYTITLGGTYNKRITVAAPLTEGSETPISVTR